MMLASLAVILLVPVALLLARWLRLQSDDAALHGVRDDCREPLAGPPVVGWLAEGREASGGQRGPS
jgi:hypothetical protein